MTVTDLIRVLETCPPDLRVMVQGYEDGVDDLEPDCVLTRDVLLNVNEGWYYGRHEEASEGDKQGNSEIVKAVVLRRPWHDD